MAAVVDDANRVLAAVVAKDGPPSAALAQVYADPLLSRVQQPVADMRRLGQYRDARRIRHDVRSVRQLPSERGFATYEVIASEEWDDRLFSAAGGLLRTSPSPQSWRYLVELLPQWRITEAASAR
jgi:hypothetical protein